LSLTTIPYSIRKSRNKWQIVKKPTGEVVGTSDTYINALKSMRARYAGERGNWKPTGKPSTLKKKLYRRA